MTIEPKIILPTNALDDNAGYFVELGDQRFTQHQWELIQLYAEGNARAQGYQNPMDYHDKATAARKEAWDKGYTPEHDDEHGLQHLLAQVQHYQMNNDHDAAAGIVMAAREFLIRNSGHKAQRQNAAFHKAFGIATASSPRAIPAEDVPVVIELIREEFIDELIPALGFKVTFTNDGKFDTIERVAEPNVQEIYDAFIDILYVTYGGMNRAGMQAEPGYDEVQASNMSKLGLDGKPIIAGPNDPDGIFEGRVKKGPNYFKPNLRRVLIEQGWRDDSEQIDFGGFEDH